MRGEIRSRSPRADVVVIAAGIFVTTLGWPSLLGRYPLGLYLKDQLHLAPQQVAAFWAVAAFAWCGKPLNGLLCDAVPLFGRRWDGYLAAGAAAAGALWLALAVVPPAYGPLLATMVALVVATAFMSTAVGGMLVETGQRLGATGRLSSLRQGLVGIAALLAGPLGGWLAERPLGFTAAAGALVALALLPVMGAAGRAPARASGGTRADAWRGDAWIEARRQLGVIARARGVHATAGLLFLAYLAPSLQTPLLYYQLDVLKWNPRLMGMLQVPGAVGALAGAAVYAVVCRFVPLGRSLALGILLNVIATLLYLGYRSPASAAVITGAAGVLGTLALLPLYDLAARAAPKGSESLGFAVLMSVQTLASHVLSDVLGSLLYGRFHLSWTALVLVNAGWTAAVLLYLPLLPRALVTPREGLPAGAPPATPARPRAPRSP